MCGIAGMAGSFNSSVEELHELGLLTCKALNRRGPDFHSVKVFDQLMLCHSRLSIIDTSSAAHQPMSDVSGRYTIVLNGEIFNYKDLQKVLIEKGYSFQTSSDTEVALYALIHYGHQAFPLFNGFFSIAFFDKESKSLILGRDRYGEKPLYYSYNQGILRFASEIKALKTLGGSYTEDIISYAFYFFLTYIPGNDTAYNEIKKIPPACYAIFNNDQLSIQSYYHFPTEKSDLSYSQACRQFADLLEDSVRIRLVSDVALGSFLSAGIDSTLISLLAAKHKPDLSTFSVGFPSLRFFDESELAAKTAHEAGIANKTIQIGESELLDSLDNVLDYLDEPFADSSAIAVYALSKASSKHAKVFLTGDGADELLGGYNKHKAWALLEKPSLKTKLFLLGGRLLPHHVGGRDSLLANRMRQLRRLSSAADRMYFDRYFFLAANNPMNMVIPFLNEEILKSPEFEFRWQNLESAFTRNSEISILKNDFDLVLEGDMLRKTDLMSMANSIELRSPFLDYRLVDFVFSLPDSYKFSAQRSKMIARDAFSTILPMDVMAKKKQGFEVPLKKWFEGPLKQKINEKWMLPENFSSPLFNKNQMKKVLLAAQRNQLPESLIWSMIVYSNRKPF